MSHPIYLSHDRKEIFVIFNPLTIDQSNAVFEIPPDPVDVIYRGETIGTAIPSSITHFSLKIPPEAVDALRKSILTADFVVESSKFDDLGNPTSQRLLRIDLS